MMGDGAIWPCAIERASGEGDGRRVDGSNLAPKWGKAAAGGGCACSRSEPCALRFVPLDGQTVPRRKDVTSQVLRPTCAVLSGACVHVVCEFERECECVRASVRGRVTY